MEKQDKPEEKKEAPAEGLSAADAHDDKPKSDDKPGDNAPEQKPEASDKPGDSTSTASRLFDSIADSSWNLLKKAKDTASAHLPDLSGLLLSDAKTAAAAPPVKQLDGNLLQAGIKPADAPNKTEESKGMFGKVFDFLSSTKDSLADLFKSGKNDGRDLFESGVKKDPFASGDNTDPFFRGFAWSSIGGGLGNMAFAGMSAGRALMAGTEQPSFKFDGVQKPEQDDSTFSGLFGYVSDTVSNISQSVSEYFFSGSEGETDTAAAPTLLDSAVEGAKKIGDTVVKGSDALLDYIFGNDNDLPAGDAPKITKDANGNVTYDGKGPNGERLHVESTDTTVTAETDKVKVQKDKQDGSVDIETSDGRTASQGPDGIRKASSPLSNVTIEEDSKTGKIKVKDQSGHQLYEFTDRGDAKRFFDNGALGSTRPGESVEQAVDRMRQDPANANKDIVVLDGNGNVMSRDTEGNTYRRHPNGTTEIHQRRVDNSGKETTVDIRVSPARNGNGSIVEIKQADGRYVDAQTLSGRQLARVLEGTNLSAHQDEHGRHEFFRRRHHQRQGEAEEQRLIGPQGQVQMQDNAAVKADGTVVVESDGKTVEAAPAAPQTQTDGTPAAPGGVVFREPDGRVTTVDPEGKVTSIGANPDGTPNPADTITYDPETRTLEAWDIVMNPEGMRVNNDDGSSVFVNPEGEFNIYDPFGLDLFNFDGENFNFWDGTSIDEDNYVTSDYFEESGDYQREMAEAKAQETASQVSAFASSIASAAAGVVDPGAVAGMLSQIEACIARLSDLGVSIPSELLAAKKQLQDVRPQFDRQINIQNRLRAEAGTVNDTILNFALRSGAADPATAVKLAVDRWKNQH